jgi:hypothetical protein
VQDFTTFIINERPVFLNNRQWAGVAAGERYREGGMRAVNR